MTSDGPGPMIGDVIAQWMSEGDEPEIPALIDGVKWQAAYEALGYLTCPWRLHGGTCQSGCLTEPACETLEPPQGWAQVLLGSVHLAAYGKKTHRARKPTD